MGSAQRENEAARAMAAAQAEAEAVALTGLRIVLDVQHVYREGQHAADRGSRYTLGGGVHVWEAAAAVSYAAAARDWLAARGAQVYMNDPTHGILVGPYSRRNAAANALGVHAYLACHVNAGGGNYAAAEYMVGSPGQALGSRIGMALVSSFREIRSCRCVPLVQGQRGAVCIEGVDRHVSALVCEPFFGDNVRQQALFEGIYLTAIGRAVGIGVAQWWQDVKASASGPVAAHR